METKKVNKGLPYSLEQPDGSVELHLKERIVWGESSFDRLTFIKPKAKHIKKMDLQKVNLGDIMDLGARLAKEEDVSTAMLDELCIEDLMKMAEVISGFLGGGADSTTP